MNLKTLANVYSMCYDIAQERHFTKLSDSQFIWSIMSCMVTSDNRVARGVLFNLMKL